MLMAAKNQVRVCALSIKHNIMREMLNQVTFFMNVTFMILNNASILIQWFILFRLREEIGGYTMREIMLLWGLTAASFGLSHILFARVYSLPELIVNFFTASDFSGLLTRRAMLPLIVFSLLFGFGVNLNGGRNTPVGKFLEDLSGVMLKVVKIVTYYAPIAFFGFFADLVATYGPQITENYARALAVYYPLCLIYIFTAWPLFAWFGGGKGAIKTMFSHIARPAIVSLGTCSSVATIPTNMEEAEDTGISKDVSDMVVPLGATMHMDGSCFSCVLKIAFVLGVFGVPFEGVGMLVKVVLVAVLSSVGMSGVPGGGYIGEYIICSIFFPNQMELAYPILVAIGNLVDPPATMINAAGDYVVSFIVSRFVDGKDWLEKALAKRK